jgi:hypothetical protein
LGCPNFAIVVLLETLAQIASAAGVEPTVHLGLQNINIMHAILRAE